MSQTTTSVQVLRRDPEFEQAMIRAYEECAYEIRNASKPVAGAYDRVGRAMDEAHALNSFSGNLVLRLASGTMGTLPLVVSDDPLVAAQRVLAEGPWQGIFAVSDNGIDVAGLLFMRRPLKPVKGRRSRLSVMWLKMAGRRQ